MEWVTILSLFLFLDSGYTCTKDVCFTWKASKNRLVFSCEIGLLLYRVRIIDPHNNIRADCLPPFPKAACEAFKKNSTIRQDTKTNITIYEVFGKIDKGVNGIWRCQHGTGRGKAVTKVTTLSTNDWSILPENLIKIIGPSTVCKDDKFWVYCESKRTLQSQAAQFEIDHKNIDTIRYFNNTCYSAYYGDFCDSQHCGCFGEGRLYNLRMVAKSVTGKMTIGCTMEIYRNGNPSRIFDSKDVFVIDSPAKELFSKGGTEIIQTSNVMGQTKTYYESTTDPLTVVPRYTTTLKNIQHKQVLGYLNIENVIIAGIVIIGILLMVLISTIVVCLYKYQLRCYKREPLSVSNVNTNNVVDNQLDIEMNDQRYMYHTIDENQMHETGSHVPVSTPSAVLERQSEIVLSEVPYLEVLPDIEIRYSYESLRGNIADDDHHNYLSCPMTKISSKSADELYGGKLQCGNGDKQLVHLKLNTI